MKTCLVFGVLMALCGFVLNLALFLSGMHSDPAKFAAAQWISGIVSLAIVVVGIVWGTRTLRNSVPAEKGFSYGQAFAAGAGITGFSALAGAVTQYLYMGMINPRLNEIILQSKIDRLTARGLSDEQIDQAEKIMRMMMTPVLEAVFGLCGAVLLGLVISLITSAFLQRAPAPAAVPGSAA